MVELNNYSDDCRNEDDDRRSAARIMRLVPWLVQAEQSWKPYMRSRRISMNCAINAPGEGSGAMKRGYKDLTEGLIGVENQSGVAEGVSVMAANLTG